MRWSASLLLFELSCQHEWGMVSGGPPMNNDFVFKLEEQWLKKVIMSIWESLLEVNFILVDIFCIN